MLSLVSKIRSSRKELTVKTEGERKVARSAKGERSGRTDKDLAMKLRTELRNRPFAQDFASN